MRIAELLGCALLFGCATGGTSDDTMLPMGGSDSGMMMPMDPDTGDPGEQDSGVVVDTGPPPCVYPSGPYGKTTGSVVSPSLQWQGYAPGGSSVTTITAKDLHDCDGRFAINAVLFDESALWCGPCQQEAQLLPSWMSQSWGALGVKVVSLVIEDLQGKPATTANALTWRNQFNLAQTVFVVADPSFSFAHSGTNGLPMNVLVDPRTMKIVKIVEGYGGMDPSVAQLANKNK